MFRLCRTLTSRVLLGGIVAALAGFSFALATSDSRSAEFAARAQSRIVGTGLRFTNPFLLPGQDSEFPSGGDVANDPDGFDLGDAVFGSQIVRYLTAANGVSPYIFSSPDLSAGSGLVLDSDGKLTGAVPVGSSSPAKFTGRVDDTSGLRRTGRFVLNVLAQSAATFRFAHDRLSSAQVGQDYITNIEVLNTGSGTVFSVASGSITFNGAAVANLEAVGLRLFPDGTIAGRPLNSGTLTFTANATRQGVQALDRSGTRIGQPLTISIAPRNSVQSVLAVNSSTIRLGKPGRDSLAMQLFVNSDGLRQEDFANQEFILRVGNRVFRGALNQRGQINTRFFKATFAALKGSLKLTITREDLSDLFTPVPTSGTHDVVIQLQIGQSFLGTDVIRYNVRARRTNTQLQYRLNKDTPLGGLFQITSLVAADFFEGTAFKARFLIAPVRSSNVSFGTATDATVHIGQGFNQTLRLFNNRGSFPPDGVRRININPRTKIGQIETYPLTQSQTGVPPAPQSGGRLQTFLLGLELGTTTQLFFGEASRRIFPVVLR